MRKKRLRHNPRPDRPGAEPSGQPLLITQLFHGFHQAKTSRQALTAGLAVVFYVFAVVFLAKTLPLLAIVGLLLAGVLLVLLQR